MGEKCDPDAMTVLAYYKNPDDDTPTFVYFMDGMKGKVFWKIYFMFQNE